MCSQKEADWFWLDASYIFEKQRQKKELFGKRKSYFNKDFSNRLYEFVSTVAQIKKTTPKNTQLKG